MKNKINLYYLIESLKKDCSSGAQYDPEVLICIIGAMHHYVSIFYNCGLLKKRFLIEIDKIYLTETDNLSFAFAKYLNKKLNNISDKKLDSFEVELAKLTKYYPDIFYPYDEHL